MMSTTRPKLLAREIVAHTRLEVYTVSSFVLNCRLSEASKILCTVNILLGGETPTSEPTAFERKEPFAYTMESQELATGSE